MSQLAHLRQKIKSIQTTKKVTHAIRLVSMSLYSKMEKQSTALQHYTSSLNNFFIEHLKYAPDWKNSILQPEITHVKNRLAIVISSTKGLCGSLNSNLFRNLEIEFSNNKYKDTNFITIGSKVKKFIQEENIGKIINSYNEINSNNYITIADALVEQICNATTPYTSVVVFGTKKFSFFNQKPSKTVIIPLKQNQETIRDENNEEIIWEQDNKEILNVLAMGYLRCSLIEILFQSLISEYSSRFLAMDNSTTNAEKYLERLTLQYNKARQTAITKEVSELSAGFL